MTWGRAALGRDEQEKTVIELTFSIFGFLRSVFPLESRLILELLFKVLDRIGK